MKEFVPLQQLAVVNFMTKFFKDDVHAWKDRADVASAMSCNRQVWFGLKDDFADFPRRTEDRTGINYYEGAAAYKFMVRLVLGLESKYVCEDSIKGQIFGYWDQYETPDAAKHKLLEKIMQDIKADSRFVEGAVLSSYKYQRHEISARDLSGQQKGETILLVGNSSRHGNLSSFTDGISRVTGSKRSNAVSEIMVTHPDNEIRQLVYSQLCELKNRGILAAKISRSSFWDFSETAEKADRVYVDLPMGSHQQAEEHMVLAWQTRIYRGNTLTHLRGDPNNMGFSSPLWETAGLDSYISPEMIRADMAMRGEHNRKTLADADKAVSFCTELRAQGQSPSNAKVRDYMDSLQRQAVSENDQTAAPIPAAA